MGYQKQTASREFANWSRSYDRSLLQWLLFGPSHRAMLRSIEAIERDGDDPLRVLDIGCGTGQFAERLLAIRPETQLWGLDLVADMIRAGAPRWRGLADRALTMQADSERLPLADGQFDVVACANSFHHYPNQACAIREMQRVLKPGGRLLLIDGYRDRPWGWFIYDVCVTTLEGGVHHASARRIEQLCRDAGFETISQTVHPGMAPFLLTEAIRDPVTAWTPPQGQAPREQALQSLASRRSMTAA